MRIAILTWGSRGDVQPYVALGHELVRRGHRVVVAANENHADWIRRAGLETVPLPLDVQAAFDTEEARLWLAAGRTLAFIRWLGKVERQVREPLVQALIAACQGADLAVSHFLLTHRAAALAEKNDFALVRVATFPTAATGEYPSPYLYNGMPALPFAFLRRGSHQLVRAMGLRTQREDLALMRQRLGLPPLAGSADDDLERRGVQTLHVFSTEVLPRPADWPADQQITGYCPLPATVRAAVGEGTVPPDLAAWLDAGPPPVYFGFGSMPVLDPPYILRMLGDVCQALGLRGLVGTGWTRFGAPDGDHLKVVGAFNHDLVLPRCRAAVHHGGSGTTGTILTAGLPAVIASVFADQPLWGDRVTRLGAGTTLPFQKLTTPALRAALEKILAPDVTARAREIGARLRAENGLAVTTDAVLAAAGGEAGMRASGVS